MGDLPIQKPERGRPNGSVKVTLATLGCKLNQAETEQLGRKFSQAGYRLVSPGEKADIYILNTCTVTRLADSKSRHLLRLAHRHHPNALIIATGCYAERARPELARIEGVNVVLGNHEKSKLLEVVEGLHPTTRPSGPPAGKGLRARSFIKIQDGCSHRCAYCIVPRVRGRERSLPAEGVIGEIQSRLAEGYQEVILTGVKIGSYDDDGVNLKGLIERILAETGLPRLRLSSLQPREISAGLIDLWQDRRLCRHFHLSLQSGSDSVLQRMKRGYSTGDYRQSVSLIRSRVPEAAITTDVIAGFPGETEKEFQQSYDFCREMAFARIHVFPYSPRPETEAAGMPGQIGDRPKKQRVQKILALGEESVRNFSQRFLGQTMPVLWEKRADGLWSGHTDNYIKVYTESRRKLTNKLLPVRLFEIREDGMRGEVVE